MASFDSEDEKYKCCCGHFVAKRAILYLSVGEIILALCNVTANPLYTVLLLAGAVCGLVALKKCDPKWMKADFYIHLAVVGVGLATALLYLGLAAFSSRENIEEEEGGRSDNFLITYLIVGFLLAACDFALLIWFTLIVKAAAMHMRHEQEAVMGGQKFTSTSNP